MSPKDVREEEDVSFSGVDCEHFRRIRCLSEEVQTLKDRCPSRESLVDDRLQRASLIGIEFLARAGRDVFVEAASRKVQIAVVYVDRRIVVLRPMRG